MEGRPLLIFMADSGGKPYAAWLSIALLPAAPFSIVVGIHRGSTSGSGSLDHPVLR